MCKFLTIHAGGLDSTCLTRLSGRPTNPETLVSLVQTINFASEGKTCALVRVPSPDSDLLPYALDAGKHYRSLAV